MGLLTKLLVFYLIMALCATLYAPEVILGESQDGTILSFFKVSSFNGTISDDDPNQNISLGDGFATEFNLEPNAESQSVFSKIINNIGGAFNYLIDGLANVLGVFKLVFRVIFSPIILLFSPAAVGMPTIIGLFIGLPTALLMIFAIVAFIAGRVNP